MNPNCVVLACDGAYLPPALFVAHQLSAQKRRAFDVVLLRTDLGKDDPLLRHEGITVIPAKDIIDASLPTDVVAPSPAMFARLLVHRLLPAGYWKALYLDADIWIATDGIQSLFDLDLAGFPIAAVRDNYEVFAGTRESFVRHKEAIGMSPASPYFNSGVLLIDLERWVAERIGERALAYVAAGNNIDHHDQTALNAVVDGRWRELPPRWNWTHATKQRLTEDANPAIIHFIGSSKPWNDRRARYPSRYGEAMRTFYIAAGFPDFYAPPSPAHYLRRQASRWLRGIKSVIHDRRERAIRNHMNAGDFLIPTADHR